MATKTFRVYRATFGPVMGWGFNGYIGETPEEAIEEAFHHGEATERDVKFARIVDHHTNEVIRRGRK